MLASLIYQQMFWEKIDMPIFLSPVAMQGFFIMRETKQALELQQNLGPYSMSIMATSSIEEISNISGGPKMFQIYIHKIKV